MNVSLWNARDGLSYQSDLFARVIPSSTSPWDLIHMAWFRLSEACSTLVAWQVAWVWPMEPLNPRVAFHVLILQEQTGDFTSHRVFQDDAVWSNCVKVPNYLYYSNVFRISYYLILCLYFNNRYLWFHRLRFMKRLPVSEKKRTDHISLLTPGLILPAVY